MFLTLLLTGLGVGARAGIGLLPSPLATRLPLAVALVVVIGALLKCFAGYHWGPVKNVDWATADAYERDFIAAAPPVVRTALRGAQRMVRDHMPHVVGVYPYVVRPDPCHERECTFSSGCCSCRPLRAEVTLMPGRRRVVLAIGDKVLEQPTSLSLLLPHTASHARVTSRLLRVLPSGPFVAGWLVLGLAVPPRVLLFVVPALLLITGALCWADELRADAAASQAVGPDAARGHWELVRLHRHGRHAIELLHMVARLRIQQPPGQLRAELAVRTHSRPAAPAHDDTSSDPVATSTPHNP
ncbi:hypothetical protein AB0H37_00100 [Actinomadura sp. NPDC023710]|uniref:hypothetical protein n=1 Tax=Actinomadura sp. NPDC023710 TaxID=3158219 RepID=UPI00340010CC